MQHLAGDITVDSIVWYIFLQRLLPTFHTAAVGEDIEKLARIAHNIANLNSTNIVSIFGIRNLESDPLVKSLESYQKLETKLEEITKRMHTFTSSCATSSRPSRRSMEIMILRLIYTGGLGIKLMTAILLTLANLKQERAREKPKVIRCTSLGSVCRYYYIQKLSALFPVIYCPYIAWSTFYLSIYWWCTHCKFLHVPYRNYSSFSRDLRLLSTQWSVDLENWKWFS